jgi:hypothetical protein
VVRQINDTAKAVFTHGYVTAMHVTLILPIVTLAIGAASCLLLKRRAKSVPPTREPEPAIGGAG